MSILDVLASLPQIRSRRIAFDLLAELKTRGLAIVPADQVVLDGPADMTLAAACFEPLDPEVSQLDP